MIKLTKIKIHNDILLYNEKEYKLKNKVLFNNFDSKDIDVKVKFSSKTPKGEEYLNNFINAMIKIGAVKLDEDSTE